MISQTTGNKQVKAVGLISGGLDSTLAAKVIKDLGIEVHGVFFAMPWGCCDKAFAEESARKIGINFITLQLDERYLEIVKKPRYGRGIEMNPCKDCRIHMFKRAAQYMRHIGADFVFTGEVLGQRPMSQTKKALTIIEQEADLEGLLLRPLSAQRLPPTKVEEAGLVDRSKLLHMVGRGRKPQYALAKEHDISGFSAPAGGCALTKAPFAKRMKDTLKYGYRNFRETISLKWGRHYRFDENFKCIVGRDEEENNGLLRYAHPEDFILQLHDQRGPTCLLKGDNPSEEFIQYSAGIVQRFSRYKDDAPQEFTYWQQKNRNEKKTIVAASVTEEQLENWKIA